jgi:hypothetical protein
MIIEIKAFLVFCIWLLNTEIHDELGIYVESVSQMKRDNAFTLIDCSEMMAKQREGLGKKQSFVHTV